MRFLCDSKYLVFPVNHHAQKKRLEFYHESKLVYDLEIELDYIHPDYEVYIDVERFSGKELELHCNLEMDIQVQKSQTGCVEEKLYHEKYRPGFHFSAKRGWLNDPNGLVHYEGQYHLFFQHNPAGCKWGNMHWGHAVSNDLIHWQEFDIALFPDERGTMFSGCAVIDEKNITGLQQGEHKVILLYYTAAGDSSLLSKGQPSTQCMAYSTDGGKTFVKYAENPVVGHIVGGNRDPKIVYHPQTDRYVMALYLKDNLFALLTSKNLLDWKQTDEVALGDDWECPDFYPLAVDGDENKIKWVLTAASDRYQIGTFDGTKFIPESDVKKLHYAKNSYASQSFFCLAEGDNRRVRMAWNNFALPLMPFHMSMTMPCEMQLKTIGGEVFLCTQPIDEIECLHHKIESVSKVSIKAEEIYQKILTGRLFDIEVELDCAGGASFEISLFGAFIQCDTKKLQITCQGDCAPLFCGEKIKLRILVDVGGLELYVSQGEVYYCSGAVMDYNLNRFEIKALDADVILEELKIAQMHNIWK